MNITLLMPWNSGVEWSSFPCIRLLQLLRCRFVHYCCCLSPLIKIFLTQEYAPFQGYHYYIWWMYSNFAILFKFRSYGPISWAYFFLVPEKLSLGLRIFHGVHEMFFCCQWGCIVHSWWIYWGFYSVFCLCIKKIDWRL